MRGKARSSANLVAPVTLARPSTRRNGLPMMLFSRCGASSGSGLRIGSAIIFSSLCLDRAWAARLRCHARRIGRAVEDLARRRAVLAAHPGGGPFDPFEDLVIAGAAAEVAGERLAHLVAARGGVRGEERLGGHQDPRRAVAALGGAEVGEGGLQG